MKSSRWTRKEDAIIRRHFISKGASECAAMLSGRTSKACGIRANRFMSLKRARTNAWTLKEEAILTANYPLLEAVGCAALLPGRSESACRKRALSLRLKLSQRRRGWTPAEIATLEAVYTTRRQAGCAAQLPGRSWLACKAMAFKLKLTPGARTSARRWTPDEDAVIREMFIEGGEMFREGGAERCALLLPNRTKKSCRTRAYTLGLRRTEKSYGMYWSATELQILREFFPQGSEMCWTQLRNRSKSSIERKAAELGLSLNNPTPLPWTPDELSVLRECFPHGGGQGVHERLPHRSIEEIGGKADQYGIAWLPSPWTAEEDQQLIAAYQDGFDASEQVIPNRTTALVTNRCRELNLSSKRRSLGKDVWMQPAKLMGKARPAAFTHEEDEAIRAHFPLGGVEACRPYLEGRSGDGIARRAHTLKVRKQIKQDHSWKSEEDETIRTHYPSGGMRGCYAHMRWRSLQSIRNRASALGLNQTVQAALSTEQIAQLEQIASGHSRDSVKRLASDWGVGERSLMRRVQRLRVANAPVLEIPEGERFMSGVRR